MDGLVALALALVATGVLAVWHRRSDGRIRFTGASQPAVSRTSQPAVTAASQPAAPGTSQPASDHLGIPESPPGEDLRPFVPGIAGERATLLQFSSAFCSPCRATRRILSEVADAVPGVAHVEVDAESHLELVRRLHVLKTPTTLVLNGHGREVLRASGQPRKDAVLQALAQAVPS